MTSRVSRRDFLKMMGVAAAALSVGVLSAFFHKENGKSNMQQTFAQSAGSWTSGPDTTTVAIHATLLRNGFILYVAGSGYHSSFQTGPYEARLLNPANGSESRIPLPEDLFCAGQAQLPNGNILFAGGTLRYDIASDNCNGRWHGLGSAYEYDVASASFVKVNSMRHGRWYPSLVTLPNGRVFTTAGYDEYGDHNRLVEIYNPSTRAWAIQYDPNSSSRYCVGASSSGTCSGAGSPCYGSSGNGAAPNLALYPRMHLMPSGLVATCGMLATVRSWNPSDGRWRNIATTSMVRHYGTSILLPLQNTASERGKILLVGGSPTSSDPATTRVEIVDFNQGTSTSPVVRTVASLRASRKFLLPIILPDGKVVVFGGAAQGNSNPRYAPEMFDPVNESWTNLASASVPRVYHGVALLIRDGRVWTAGSTSGRSRWELRTEFFRPWYYSQTRPAISSTPTVGSYGGTITIPTSQASNIGSVNIVRLPNTTHHYDTDQRLVWLQIQSRTSSSVTVSAPINSRIAPPGYYLLHVLRSGIPSRAWTIRIR